MRLAHGAVAALAGLVAAMGVGLLVGTPFWVGAIVAVVALASSFAGARLGAVLAAGTAGERAGIVRVMALWCAVVLGALWGGFFLLGMRIEPALGPACAAAVAGFSGAAGAGLTARKPALLE